MRSRLEQVYIWTLRELNSIGLTIGGRTLSESAKADVDKYLEPSQDEIASLFAGLVAMGVDFLGEPGAEKRFHEHPIFGKLGSLKAGERNDSHDS